MKLKGETGIEPVTYALEGIALSSELLTYTAEAWLGLVPCLPKITYLR